jgi:hypothetical protein
MAMMAITTNNSMRVKADRLAPGRRQPENKGVAEYFIYSFEQTVLRKSRQSILNGPRMQSDG